MYKTKMYMQTRCTCKLNEVPLFTGKHSTEDASLLQYTQHTGSVMSRPAKEFSEIC